MTSGRLLLAITSTLSEKELFEALVSPGVETVPAFAIGLDEDELTATMREMLVDNAPGARGPGFVHVTSCDAAPQVQPPAFADTKVNPAARVSVSVMLPVVAALPTLLTERENSPSSPAPKFPL